MTSDKPLNKDALKVKSPKHLPPESLSGASDMNSERTSFNAQTFFFHF